MASSAFSLLPLVSVNVPLCSPLPSPHSVPFTLRPSSYEIVLLGYPLCSLPLGCIDYNGRPVGLVAIAQDEHTLVTLMSAFEASFPSRELPSAFLDHEDPVGSH